MIIFYLTMAVVILSALSYITSASRRCTIPGPRGWPFVGIYPTLGHDVYRHYTKLSKKYGDIFFCRLYNEGVIVISKFEVIHHFFQKRQGTFNNRFAQSPAKSSDAPIGFGGLHYGDRWREMRSFTTKVISNPTLGDRNFEDLLSDEVSHFCSYIINLKEGTEFNPSSAVMHFVENVMLTTVFGKRIEYTSQMEAMTTAAVDASRTFDALGSSWIASVIKVFFQFNMDPFKEYRLKHVGFYKLLTKCVKELAEHRNNTHKSDFVDSFNSYADNEKQLGEVKSFFNETTLLATIANLMLAALSATGPMLLWIILLLTKHQDVQKKLRMEVDEVIGRDRRPTLEDKESMNYFKAVMQEIYRTASEIPIVQHASAEDAEYQGHFIPKGTYVTANLWGIHHDERLFSQPFDFNPGRFLDESGKFMHNKYVLPFGIGRFLDESGKFIHKKYVLPFGIGKRSCAGEVLLQKVFFLFVTQLLQKFEIKPTEGTTAESLNSEGVFDGVLISPPRFQVRIIKL